MLWQRLFFIIKDAVLLCQVQDKKTQNSMMQCVFYERIGDIWVMLLNSYRC